MAVIAALLLAAVGQVSAADEKKPAEASRLRLNDFDKLVALSNPQLSPDGKSVVVVVGRPSFQKNRTDTELVLVDVATGKQRVLTRERRGVGQPRW
jgi:hypothetical protein